MALLHGFDVSHWQGSGIPGGSYTFLGIKATEGSGYTDSTVSSHRSKARAKGVVPIFYHFARPEQSSAASQAKRLVNAAGARKGELLCLDLEASKLSQSGTNKWAKAFGDALRKLAPGIKTVVYVGGYAHNGSGKGLNQHFDFWWYPRYPSSSHTTTWPTRFNPVVGTNTTGWAKPHIWQFTAWWGGNTDANISWLTKADLTGAGSSPTQNPIPTGGNDLYSHYNSAGVTKALALEPNKYNVIPWDTIYGGTQILKDHPRIVMGPGHYQIKVRYRISGLPAGTAYVVRLTERADDGKGGWKVVDTVSEERTTATAGDVLEMHLSGPDTQAKGSRVWLEINPGSTAGAKLEYAYVKADYA